jgi:putative addiction module component (TIGR02574 family)
MVRKPEELYKEALKLSEEEREELVRLLTMQADSGWASPEIEQAWMEECDRRMKAIEDGTMELIPADQVYRHVRERLAKNRQA